MYRLSFFLSRDPDTASHAASNTWHCHPCSKAYVTEESSECASIRNFWTMIPDNRAVLFLVQRRRGVYIHQEPLGHCSHVTTEPSSDTANQATKEQRNLRNAYHRRSQVQRFNTGERLPTTSWRHHRWTTKPQSLLKGISQSGTVQYHSWWKDPQAT